ncbi:LuxR C-terminal-related transcriptional regulator [Dactylosporangium sp. AC04546]|uniref:ATP-binding protein n=1 Tax=Dactylosporangium sp. AC04546 TaxID=2862460 RepID=UPI002E7C3E76|nr:LuxR C-terminal-related transcriptional regulator [Dactylosporangium sp. AC04546]WVK80951.1 LuxR C-terminal-related transcriptional regulator [Dactylosporangium sp. AC04546]
MTERERDVLRLVAGHLTNLEIAARLSVSVRTVESHVSSLIRKLEVSDRRGLARRAEELDLLRPKRLHGWPSPANLFVGRDAETAALHTRLKDHRLVTVTGPGGVGKTRLTTHAVQQVARDRPDGAWFVDLSQVATPQAAVPAIAAAVGVAEQPGQFLDDTLSEVLSRADGVLVLDNCEHLLPELETCVARLVGDCLQLTIVATSRAPLRAPYEWVYELPSLSTEDAVRLFRSRAEAAGGIVPDDPRVAELCHRIEGMALAIELAAARYPLLGLDGLAAALGDPLRLLGSAEGARQRSLRATIGWSVDLLDDEARAMFAALFVFAAPFTVAAAHAVACPDHTLAAAARVLATLADQHLLYVEPGNPTRYHFQEVVRQFAAELLADAAGELEQRHARWAAAELTSLASAEHDDAWCARFDQLAVEVRAALARPVDGRQLGEFFAEELVQRGRLEEAQHRFETLAATKATDAHDRVHLLRRGAAAAAARLVGDDALRLLDEAAAAATVAADPGAAADALGWSVIYAAFHPGIMANPPEPIDIERRLAEARRLAPTGSPAEATVAAASALCLPNDDPEAEAAGRLAAEQAIAAGLPVVASAALDRVCVSQVHRGNYAGALAAVRARGVLMDPQPLSAATAYAFNDYLLMGCEVSLAAGDLRGAKDYAERLAVLPCYREYVHPALARRLQVDALTGDLTGAVERGERFLGSWERAGRHRASTLAVGAYALALVHGLLGDDHRREAWRNVTEHLRDRPTTPTDGPAIGWAATFDAWLLLHRDQPHEALAQLSADLHDATWSTSPTLLLWRPWYAAAWAEAAALTASPDLDQRLASATVVARGNPVAAALVRRAGALARGDHEEVAALAAVFEDLGALYQRDRSRQLSR